MTRRILLVVLALSAATAATVWLAQGPVTIPDAWPAPTHPLPRHVVVISLDTLRADAIGAYGHPTVTTPTLDALAARGVRFDQHTSAAPSTLASHTSIFTGTYPHTHGIPRNDYIVPEANRMMPEVLGEHGFDTAAFIGAIPIASHSGFTQGFDHVDEAFSQHRDEGKVDQTQRDAPEVTDAVLSWAKARTSSAPMFLFVHYFDVHAPYAPPAEWRAHYGIDEEHKNLGSMRSLDRLRRQIKRDKAPEGAVDTVRQLYLAGVSWTDAEVGRLLEGLAALGLMDDTLVLVTSDHGETYTSHEQEIFDHGATVYEETVRVPLIAVFPEDWGAGRTVQRTTSSVDVWPTLLEILGLPLEASIEGRSLMPLVRNDDDAKRVVPVFSEATKPHSKHDGAWLNEPMRKAVRIGPAKLHLDPQARNATELYNLNDDPSELAPVTDAETQARLQGVLDAWRAKADPWHAERDSSARRKAELQALGYLQDE